MKPIILRPGYTYEELVRMGVYYEYHELLELGECGLFPKQPVPCLWDAEEIVDWFVNGGVTTSQRGGAKVGHLVPRLGA